MRLGFEVANLAGPAQRAMDPSTNESCLSFGILVLSTESINTWNVGGHFRLNASVAFEGIVDFVTWIYFGSGGDAPTRRSRRQFWDWLRCAENLDRLPWQKSAISSRRRNTRHPGYLKTMEAARAVAMKLMASLFCGGG